MARKSRKNRTSDSIQEISIERIVRETEPLMRYNTACYCRLSVESAQTEDSGSLDNQAMVVKKYIEMHPELNLVETYCDNGFSGTNFERPGFQRMLEDIKHGRIQCVVVKDLSRFGRNYIETGYYIEYVFSRINVRLIAVTDNFDSFNDHDRNSLELPVKNMVNAMYAKDISKKITSSVIARREKGTVKIGRLPYGYGKTEDHMRYVVDPNVSGIVQVIYQWALLGIERNLMAKRLNRLNIPAPSVYSDKKGNSPWSFTSVNTILSNPVNVGDTVYGKTTVALYKGQKTTKNPKEEWTIIPDTHEPIVTRDDFKRVQEMYAKAADNPKRRRLNSADAFQGKVFCKECGRKMNLFTRQHQKSNTTIYLEYQCVQDAKYYDCAHNEIHVNFLRMVVLDQIKALLQTTLSNDLLKSIMQTGKITDGIAPLEADIRKARRALNSNKEKQSRVYEDYSNGILDYDDFRTLNEKLVIGNQSLEKKIDSLFAEIKIRKNKIQSFIELTRHIQEMLDDQDKQQALFDELIEKIIVGMDGSVEILFSCADLYAEVIEYTKEGAE